MTLIGFDAVTEAFKDDVGETRRHKKLIKKTTMYFP